MRSYDRTLASSRADGSATTFVSGLPAARGRGPLGDPARPDRAPIVQRSENPFGATGSLPPSRAFDRLPLLPSSGPVLQAQLTVGAPGDVYEQEADRVADAVAAAGPAPDRRMSCACGGSCPACQKRKRARAGQAVQTRRVRRTATTPATAPPSVGNALESPGRQLDPASRSFMEGQLGHDFSHVRVHTGAGADRSSTELGARAYTVGNEVVFRKGEYAPHTPRGRRLLAHELTHVVQQTGGETGGRAAESRVASFPSPTVLSPLVQRDLAIQPPRPDAVPQVLTPAQVASAIAFNERVLGGIANSAEIIDLIRDVIGISPQPAVVDEDFVDGVVRWQASFGLGQDGRLGPATARPLFREIGAEGVGRGEVSRPPRYRPAGPINVPRAGARQATFNFTAEFRSDPANHILPSCCEVRQDIQWDDAIVAASVAAGNPVVPHVGFPAAHPANTWIEDRDDAGGRYGHRTGPNSDPGAGDRYLDAAGQQNQAFGHRYQGRDTPFGLAADRGSWSFRLRVIDVCRGNRQLAVSPTLVFNWL
jgi:hypothetical protein